MHSKVVIIGSGPAGLTAALYAARANLEPLVIRGLQPGGLIATTSEVENYPGFVEGVGGFDLADNMEKQAARFGAQFMDALVEQVDFSERPFKLTIDSGEIVTASDEGYDLARRVWNDMIDRRPQLIVRPRKASDVAAAVNFFESGLAHLA